MSTAKKLERVSVEDYLARELISPVKYEYLGAVLYAMAGARNAHNLIATNTVGVLHARLRGRPCRPFNSDTKIRVRLPTQVRFYYPDVSVVRRPNAPTDSFQDEPAMLHPPQGRPELRRVVAQQGGSGMGPAEFTTFIVLARVAFRRPAPGGHYRPLSRKLAVDWPAVGAAAVGTAGAVAVGWAVFGPGWLPWWACVAVAFTAGAACEWLAGRWCR